MILEQKWNILAAGLLIVGAIAVNSFYKSNNQINPACSEENIDWDIAVGALSQHFKNLAKNNPDIDFGPADIRRHFAENCEEDLKIYEKYLASYDWVEWYFNNRIKDLVGADKYKDIIKYYTDYYPKEFSGCEDYLFETGNARADDIYSIRGLIEEKKYKEVITLGDKYLKDSEVWYCDSFFWTQRAQAFYNLNSCSQAEADAAHAFAVAPGDNGNDKPARDLYNSIISSDICVTNY